VSTIAMAGFKIRPLDDRSGTPSRPHHARSPEASARRRYQRKYSYLINGYRTAPDGTSPNTALPLTAPIVA
jgi:hypothetical protein